MARCTTLTDADAARVVALWNATFTEAFLIPRIGIPSQDGGVITIAHNLQRSPSEPEMDLLINGLPSMSPLAEYALYSAECSNGRFINLYEVMLPELPGSNGTRSTTSIYVDALGRQGLQVAGFHFHWLGFKTLITDAGLHAIHSQSEDLDPLEFSRRTIEALKEALDVILLRSAQQQCPTSPKHH